MPVSSAEYKKLLDREKNRYPNDRDRAVRSANVAAGYGSSTALKHRDGGSPDSGKPKPKAADSPAGSKPKAKASSSPFKLPSKAPAPTPRPGGAAKAPVPTPRPTQFPPDLAVSPSPAQPNSPVGPTNAAQPFGNPAPGFTPPMNPAMSQASVLQTPPPELMQPQLPPMSPALSMASILQTPPPGLTPPPDFAGLPMPPALGGTPPGLAGAPPTAATAPAPPMGGAGRGDFASLAAQAGMGGMGRQFPPASPLLDPRLRGY